MPQPEKISIRELARGKEEELYEIVKKAESFIDGYRPLFNSFARDVSLEFVPKAEDFKINLETGKVDLDIRWFKEKDYNLNQLIWACFHELGHFKDMKRDPEAFKRKHEYIESKGRFWKSYHIFYNVLDDIYVNFDVAESAPAYDPEEAGGQEVKKLYQEKLFPVTDYTKQPRHLQFIYALLRRQMVPEEKIKVSPEVEKVLKKKIKIFGREYDLDTIINIFIKPALTPEGKEENIASRRYRILKDYIEPLYEKLLEEDKKDPRWKSDVEKGKNPFESFYREFEENNVDQIPDKDIKDWIDQSEKEKKEEEKGEKEEEKSPQRKAKEAQKRADEEFAKKHNISPEEMKNFRKIEAEITPYLDKLSELWRSIVYGKSEKVKVALRGFYRTGLSIDISQAIKEWPQIETGKAGEVKIYIRPEEEKVLVERPELIRVHLVCDLSSSMDSSKRRVLKQSTVLLLRSLEEFQTYLNLTRGLTGSKLNVDTEVWGFGNKGAEKRLKRFSREEGRPEELDRIEMIKCIGKLDQDLGWTYDDCPLREIAKDNTLTPGRIEDIKKEKVMDIVIEITDGGSSDAKAAIRALKELENQGVIARAIQVGEVTSGERRIFKKVWGEKGDSIGKEIENLVPAVATILAKYLSTVRL